MNISKIHTDAGYVTFCDFFNKVINENITIGIHHTFISDLTNKLLNKNVHIYISELYSSEQNYWGVAAFSTDGGCIVIKDSTLTCEYYADSANISEIMELSDDTGLLSFGLGTISLTDPQDSGLYNLQTTNETSWGNSNYYIKVLLGNNMICKSEIRARTLMETVISNYNIRLDKVNLVNFTVFLQRDQELTFSVQITEDYSETFTLKGVNDVAVIVDTPYSRKSVQKLINQGIIFSNYL